MTKKQSVILSLMLGSVALCIATSIFDAVVKQSHSNGGTSELSKNPRDSVVENHRFDMQLSGSPLPGIEVLEDALAKLSDHALAAAAESWWRAHDSPNRQHRINRGILLALAFRELGLRRGGDVSDKVVAELISYGSDPALPSPEQIHGFAESWQTQRQWALCSFLAGACKANWESGAKSLLKQEGLSLGLDFNPNTAVSRAVCDVFGSWAQVDPEAAWDFLLSDADCVNSASCGAALAGVIIALEGDNRMRDALTKAFVASTGVRMVLSKDAFEHSHGVALVNLAVEIEASRAAGIALGVALTSGIEKALAFLEFYDGATNTFGDLAVLRDLDSEQTINLKRMELLRNWAAATPEDAVIAIYTQQLSVSDIYAAFVLEVFSEVHDENGVQLPLNGDALYERIGSWISDFSRGGYKEPVWPVDGKLGTQLRPSEMQALINEAINSSPLAPSQRAALRKRLAGVATAVGRKGAGQTN